jgi:hypothetical protein
MRTANLATIHAITPPSDYDYKGGGNIKGLFVNVGMAQSIRIEDNFGTKSETVIGSPLPVFHPGFLQTTISIEKATVDGYGFRDLGGFNPLAAHIGTTYRNENLVNISSALGTKSGEIAPTDQKMYPFMFILAIRDKVSDSYRDSNMPQLGNNGKENRSIGNPNTAKGRTANTIGSYVCVLQSASISLQSSNATVVDSMTALARPLTGTWFNDSIREAFSNQKGGMDDVVNSVLFGYRSEGRLAKDDNAY